MSTFNLKKGRNIKLVGAAEGEPKAIDAPKHVGVQPPDFKGLKPRLAVKEGDTVKVGTALITDKQIEALKIVSPVSGKVSQIKRGDKRALLEVVIETDGSNETEVFETVSESGISSLSDDKIKNILLSGGLWPTLRQRPFSKIASPEDKPKSIFVHAMSTEPLALDVNVALEGKEKEFQAGLDILSRLTEGKVHLCYALGSKAKALVDAKNVERHDFAGPHPTGNVGTHISCVDPINKGDIVWFIEAQDVLRIAHLLLKGTYSAERFVAVTGEGAKHNYIAKTIVGAPLSLLAQGSDLGNVRCITGSILSGRNVGAEGFVGYYDSQVTFLPEGGNREVLGWLVPGFKKYTFSNTYASAFCPQGDVSLDTDTNGGERAIVLNHLYDDYVSIDVVSFFLLKAILAGDIDEAEKLGILECDEEDFALATFACPSKVDVGGIIRSGLELIEKEG